MPSPQIRRFLFLASIPCLLSVSACGGGGGREVTVDLGGGAGRTVARPELRLGEPTWKRMGFRRRDETPTAPLGRVVGDPPDVFTVVPPSGDRLIDLRVEDAVLTVTRLGGDVLANFNRWRRQLGLQPMASEELAALPTLEVLGVQAPRLRIQGAEYRPMRGDPIEDAALIGLVVVLEPSGRSGIGDSIFVKFVGSRTVIDAHAEAFDRFARSLRIVGAPEVKTPEPAAADPLMWTLPEGWTSADPRRMSLATFHPAGDVAVVGTLSAFPGEAGGIAANINRWLGQIGQSPLSPDGVAGLPRHQVLGVASPWIEARGALPADARNKIPAIEDAAMLGLICPAGGQTVFVKLFGPAARVAAAKEGFFEFCDSLRAR